MLSKGLYALSFGVTFAAQLVKVLVVPRSNALAAAGRKADAPVAESMKSAAVTHHEHHEAPDDIESRAAQAYSPQLAASGFVALLRHVWQRAQRWVGLIFRPLVSRRLIASLASRREALAAKGNGLFEYAVVTAAYWAFTLTDGAIRMLVLFQFHLLGYSAFQIAALFLFYEIFGVVTNFVGGWLASRVGLRFTLFGGTALQIVALAMLVFLSPTWPVGFLVAYTMFSQALSGIAKDLTKMSAKSAIKSVIPKDADPTLYRWVSLLTGSKNALKGVGFFVGALLLTVTGFRMSALIMAAGLTAILCVLPRYLPDDIGKTKKSTKFSSMFALDQRINVLSAARFFLFGARDIWFVVALPVYMSTVFGWSPILIAAYLALWTIGYGIVQALAPRFVSAKKGETPKGYTVMFWASILAAVPAAIALALSTGFSPAVILTAGLAIFGVIFAINSAIHSYMIVHYADSEKVAMTIGFYYMANAGGRLAGTVLSGLIYQSAGIVGCLWVSALFVLAAAIISSKLALPEKRGNTIDANASPAPLQLGLVPA